MAQCQPGFGCDHVHYTPRVQGAPRLTHKESPEKPHTVCHIHRGHTLLHGAKIRLTKCRGGTCVAAWRKATRRVSLSHPRCQDTGKRIACAESAFTPTPRCSVAPPNWVRGELEGSQPKLCLQGGRELPQERGGRERSIIRGFPNEILKGFLRDENIFQWT